MRHFDIYVHVAVDYSHDMSDDPANKPGRVCAGSCDKLACTDKKVCQEVAESDPECVCPCKYYLHLISTFTVLECLSGILPEISIGFLQPGKRISMTIS